MSKQERSDKPLDDQGGKSTLRASRSVAVFMEVLEDFATNEDNNLYSEASRIAKMLKEGDVGIVCADGVGTDAMNEKVIVSQVRLGKRNIPVFIVPSGLNMADLLADIEKNIGKSLPLGLDSNRRQDKVRQNIGQAIEEMTFALEARERFGGVDG